MKTWTVTINFGGFIGCDNDYTVEAETREEAIDEAMEMAMEDIEVIDVTEEDKYED